MLIYCYLFVTLSSVTLTFTPPSPDTAWCTVFAVYGEAFTHSRERVVSDTGSMIYKNLMADDLKRKVGFVWCF